MSFVLIGEVGIPITTMTFSAFFTPLTAAFSRLLLIYDGRGEDGAYMIIELS